MDRTACVDVQNLPLQALLQKNPGWRSLPVAVVDRDKPNGTILYVNKHARKCRILPGLRYGAGLSLSRHLRGGVVARADIEEATNFLTQRLHLISPRAEPSLQEPGVFWLDASGMSQLYATLNDWAQCTRSDLRSVGFYSVVAVGFTKFGTYAIARASSKNVVLESAEGETKSLREIPLECLNLIPGVRDTLFKLGIVNLGGFLDLPYEGIRKRFGAEAEALHEMARGKGWYPFVPREFQESIERTLVLDNPESDTERLLFIIAHLLNSMLPELAKKHEALKALQLELKLDDHTKQNWIVSPATPTLDTKQILQLVRLRLEGFTLSSGVVELRIQSAGERVSQQQLELFNDAPKRNLRAANQAISKIRALLGQSEVVTARIHDGHLPEAQHHWEAVNELRLPSVSAVKKSLLVRRLFSPALELFPRERCEPDGWYIVGLSEGPVDEIRGPYIVAGGWWVREVIRHYFYVRTRSGLWLWIYYDQKRRRWYLQGVVQ